MKHGKWTIKIKRKETAKTSSIEKIYWNYETNKYTKEEDCSITDKYTIVSSNGVEHYTDVYGLKKGPINKAISFSYTEMELEHLPYETLLKYFVESKGLTIDDLNTWPWFRFLPPSKYEKIKEELE